MSADQTSQIFPHLRSLLGEAPSLEAWASLCHWFDQIEDETWQPIALDYALAHLDGWPDSLRRPLYHWWREWREGEETPTFWALIKDTRMWALEPGQTPGELRQVPDLPTAALAWVPPGVYQRGASPDDVWGVEEEHPRHEVTISRGFWMWHTPITRAQYHHEFQPLTWSHASSSTVYQPDQPVRGVTWFQAMAFCNELSRAWGHSDFWQLLFDPVQHLERPKQRTTITQAQLLTSGYNNTESAAFRLPTEAEWEYACRAGSTRPTYGPLDDIAVYRETADAGNTRAVAGRLPNQWGLHDCLGNVWEWCWDYYGPYTEGPEVDPIGPSKGIACVVRGGGSGSQAQVIRASCRSRRLPSTRDSYVGFRPVLPVPFQTRFPSPLPSP